MKLNTGISAVISPNGEIESETSWDEEIAINSRVQLMIQLPFTINLVILLVEYFLLFQFCYCFVVKNKINKKILENSWYFKRLKIFYYSVVSFFLSITTIPLLIIIEPESILISCPINVS